MIGDTDYIAHITFYDEVTEEILGTVNHPVVPRKGDRVALGADTWEVENIMWMYPQPGSISWRDGHRGALVTVLVSKSEGLFR